MVRRLTLGLLFILAFCVIARGDTAGSLVLAVSDFTGNDVALCQAVTETVLTDLAKSRKVTLVERAQLRHALNELRLQTSGLAEDGSLSKAGKLVGATHVVVGSVSINEDVVILNARVLEVRTGTLYAGVAENTEGWSDQLFALAHELANRLHYRLTGESLPGFAPPQPSQANPAPPSLLEKTPSIVPAPPPDWENLAESGAIAVVLARGWMRLYADGSFRPYEHVSQRYFYETLRRVARRYRLEDSRYFSTGDGVMTRAAAARVIGALVSGGEGYYLDIPEWALQWLGKDARKPLTRAQFARLLQLAEEQLKQGITTTVDFPSMQVGGH